MAKKGLNCGINKTSIMATKIIVPDIGDFDNNIHTNFSINILKNL